MSGMFGLLLLLFSVHSIASAVTSMVHELDIDPRPGEEVLVFLSSGEVGKVSMNNLGLIERLREGKANKTWFNMVIDEDRQIVSAESTVEPFSSEKLLALDQHEEEQAFVPTVVKSMAYANKYFSEARLSNKPSQCFNRSHVWAYDWYKKHHIYSQKVFLFFTTKYIRETNFSWWFHMAPYLHVAIGNEIKERVMDKKYNKGPVTFGQWKDTFMKEGHRCATVTTYSDYANYPESGYCYFMRANMYYYWPLDLEREELYGQKKVKWHADELKMSYLDALGISI